MLYLNTVIVSAVITQEIEFTVTPKDLVIAKLCLAVNRPKKDTVFIHAVCFDKIAENCKKYLHRGSPVIVTGELDLEMRKTKDGAREYPQTRLLVNELQFLENTYKRRGLMRSDDVPETNTGYAPRKPSSGFDPSYGPDVSKEPAPQQETMEF